MQPNWVLWAKDIERTKKVPRQPGPGLMKANVIQSTRSNPKQTPSTTFEFNIQRNDAKPLIFSITLPYTPLQALAQVHYYNTQRNDAKPLTSQIFGITLPYTPSQALTPTYTLLLHSTSGV